jgi:hypothetical protein
MPRNGSGVWTAPASSSFNPAVTGQQATAPDWTALLADIAAALTQSVSQDGQTTITGNMPFGGFRLTNVGNPVNAQDAVTQAFLASFGGSYLRGLTLSNDSGSPNTVLDIAAGSCADSTNAVPIIGTAFTKSTAGSWTAGTGNNGMGSGLSVAPGTWYHVFPIINNGVYDVYFDTSVTAANKPAATTAFRRAGSILTDGSAHILAFVQDGDLFQWKTLVGDVNLNGPTTLALTKTLTVPTGVSVQAWVQVSVTNTDGTSCFTYLSDLATTDSTPQNGLSDIGAAFTGTIPAGLKYVRTNTSAQIRTRCSYSSGNVTLLVNTLGWRDYRGTDV